MRSNVAAGAAGVGEVCGNINGSGSGLPLSSKKFMCICAAVVPLFTKVNVVVQKPPDATCAIEPEPENPVLLGVKSKLTGRFTTGPPLDGVIRMLPL